MPRAGCGNSKGAQDQRCYPNVEPGGPVDVDLDTLATALYVKVGDLLLAAPHLAPRRPRGGDPTPARDAELVTLPATAVLLAELIVCIPADLYSSVSPNIVSGSKCRRLRVTNGSPFAVAHAAIHRSLPATG